MAITRMGEATIPTARRWRRQGDVLYIAAEVGSTAWIDADLGRPAKKGH